MRAERLTRRTVVVAVISTRGETREKQRFKRERWTATLGTWPRQGRRHFGWKYEAGSFDRARIHFRTARHWQSINGHLGFHAKYSLRSTLAATDRYRRVTIARKHRLEVDKLGAFVEHSDILHWEDSHRSCRTTRYVRGWQCHSRNILGEEKPMRSFLGNAKCTRVSAPRVKERSQNVRAEWNFWWKKDGNARVRRNADCLHSPTLHDPLVRARLSRVVPGNLWWNRLTTVRPIFSENFKKIDIFSRRKIIPAL